MSSDAAEPRLVSFLAERGLHEQDPARRLLLTELIQRWRALAPEENADAVWDAMVTLSREYMHATGYQKQWSQ